MKEKGFLSTHSFLICHRGALGDFLLTWPALHALKKILPDYQFLGLGRPEYMRLAITLGLLDTCLHMESAGMLDFFAGKAIPPEIGPPDGAILWLSNGKEIAALLKKFASLPVALIAPFPKQDIKNDKIPSLLAIHKKERERDFQVNRIHIALYHCLAIQSHFPITIPSNLPPYFPLKVKKGEYALIHPGSGSPRKNHSAQFYRDLADELQGFGYPKARFLFGPAEDKFLVEEFTEELVEHPKNVEALANLLAGADLYIGNDSGVSHLSGILGTPTIALYKTTDPKIWGVLGRKVNHIAAYNEKSALSKIRECLKQRDNLHKNLI